MNPTVHVPVMLEECLEALAVRPGGTYVDGTLGGGSHTEAILKASSPDGKVWSFDVNTKALEAAKQKLNGYGSRWNGVETNFRRMDLVAEEKGFSQVDGVLLDLGLSSDELEDPEKGLSFKIDGPLDMRLGFASNEDELTAMDIVNRWTEKEIRSLLQEIGEERFAGRIAEAIFASRKEKPILTTFQLVEVIQSVVPRTYEHGRIHPATRTFQALRIAVNDELGALSSAIEAAWKILAVGGVLTIISFHSLEDRVVKQAFRTPQWDPLTKRPLVPTDEEIKQNPRSRSAKLRSARKVAL